MQGSGDDEEEAMQGSGDDEESVISEEDFVKPFVMIYCMCFFHVLKNCRPKIIGKPNGKVLWRTVCQDLNTMHHMPDIANQFADSWHDFKQKWNRLLKDRGEFTAYFQKEWVDGEFKFWGQGNTATGMATTANPVEIFNALMRKLSGRKSASVSALIQLLASIVVTQSTTKRAEFTYTPLVPTIIMRRSAALKSIAAIQVSRSSARTVRVLQVSRKTAEEDETTDSEADEDFEPKDDWDIDESKDADMRKIINQSIRFFARDAEVEQMPHAGWLVNLDAPNKCPCHYYSKWGYCVHYVAACVELDEPYPGLNPRGVKLMDTRVKMAGRRKVNKSKAKGRGGSAGKRGGLRSQARGRGKGKSRGRRGGRDRSVGGAYVVG
jgi:hypothetical protein